MSFFRRVFRGLLALAILFASTVEAAITRPKTRADRAAWLSGLCSRMLRAMDIHAFTVGPVPTHGAVISNHLTFLDILVHASIRPCVFVSKAELRSTPLLGWMSMMAGTVYVQRGAGGSASKAAEGMAQGFRDGLPVTFFPEGTTGVGDEPAMPFRSGLLAEAIAVGAPVTPGFIQYTLAPEDLARGKSTREDVHWGTQSLLQIIARILGLHTLRVTLRFAEHPIVFSEAAIADRKVAAVEAREAVLAVRQASPLG